MQHIRLIIILSGLIHSLAYADISTDGSVGAAQVLNANNGQYTIAQTLGSLRGSNLFHSFQHFNINLGESATFTGSDSIQNVISRVTGGSPSNINGILQSQIGTADFYFINPAGVIFGAQAQVDVPAAFHVSTAGKLNFSDGGSFSALNPDASTLTIAEPHGFGFTQGQSGKLQIIGGQLSFKPGTNVSLSANNITIAGLEQDNGEIRQAAIFVQPSNLATEQGIHLNLTAVDAANSQVIPTNALTKTATGGTLHISHSVINSSGNGFGKIGIRAGDVTLENSILFADNTGDLNMSTENGVDVKVQSLIANNAALTSDAFSQGNAGTVLVKVSEAIQVLNGSSISSITFSAGDAGNVTVEAKDVLVDGQASDFETGIYSSAQPESQGKAGQVLVTADGAVKVSNGGVINSSTFSLGNAGSVIVEAKEVLIDGQASDYETGISSSAQPESQGEAGNVLVKTDGVVQISNGGVINSSTFSLGNAGNVTVEAKEVLVDGQASDYETGISSSAQPESQGEAGNVLVKADGIVQVLNGGLINSSTFSLGNAGSVTVEARNILVDGQASDYETGISSSAQPESQGKAGTVLVKASEIVQILNGGLINSDTFGAGDAGNVSVEGREVLIDGQGGGHITGISSDTESANKGQAGTVSVKATDVVQVLNGGEIRSLTFSVGNAGSVTVEAGKILVSGEGSAISSSAQPESQGKAGIVLVNASEIVQILDRGVISSDTYNVGDAGSVVIKAGEIVQISNGGIVSSDTSGAGDAGSVTVEGKEVRVDGQGNITGIFSDANSDSQGNAGNVSVNAGDVVQVLNGGLIRSDTSSTGDAGSVMIKAVTILVDGQEEGGTASISSSTQQGSGGNAGTVIVTASETIQLLNGGGIDSITFGAGDAGSVTVEAREVLIDGQGSEFVTGINSGAQIGSQGNAGIVLVKSSEIIQILDGGSISSVTSGTGDAGSVVVETEKILIDGQGRKEFTGISSSSTVEATGRVGNVSIVATEQIILRDSGIGIKSLNEQLQAFTTDSGNTATLSISTPILQLEKNAAITAATLGGVNAAPIEINIADSLSVKNSIISTSAVNGNGGSITINAGNWLQLQQSQITTSVSGEKNGNGGDINITTPISILDTGFIIANTTASQAQGGDINLQIDQLIPSANTLLIGGSELLEFDPEQSNFHVVQAASPSGVNGSINISSPELNITGALANITIPELNLERLGQDPCIRQRENNLQSLGHGGVPAFQNGENHMQINYKKGMGKKQRDKSIEVIQHPETSVKHFQRESLLTACKKTTLSFSQMGR